MVGGLPGAGAVPLQGVQGFSPDQLRAIELARSNVGSANPALASAQQFIQQGGQPIDMGQVQALYKDISAGPMADLANMEGQQRSQASGLATQAAGGIGGDRAGVTMSNLARQQGLARGQVGSGLLQQAINAYMQQRQQQQSAGALMGQQAGLTSQLGWQDVANQYGMGAQQQGLGQAGLNALFAQQQGQYQNPYQNLAAASGTLGTVGGALKGDTSEQTTYPGQPLAGTLAGLGMTGIGVIGGTGGFGTSGWFSNLFKPTATAAEGGRITGDPYAILERFNGGSVPHKQGGGELDDRFAPAQGFQHSFADRFAPAEGLPPALEAMPDPGLQQVSPDAMAAWRGGVDAPPSQGGAGLGQEPETALGYSGGLPRTSANPLAQMPTTGGGLPPMPEGLSPPDQSSRIAQNPWMALMQAGLGTMAAAGKRDSHGLPMSPLAAVGEGGTHGVKMLEEQQKANREERRLELASQRELEAARMARVPYGSMTASQRASMALAERKQVLEEMKPVQIGFDNYGRPIFAKRDPKTGEYLDPRTGQPATAVPPVASSEPTVIDGEKLVPGQSVSEGVNLDVLKANPDMAGTIRAIAEGREDPRLLPQKVRAPVMDMVHKYDKDWSQSLWTLRNKTEGDWAPNGKSGQSMTSFNYALRHTATLGELTKELNPSQIRTINATKNWLKFQFSDPAIEKWRNQALIVATEVPKMLRGAGVLNQQEEARWNERLLGSPKTETFLAGLGQVGEAMHARNDEMASQYKQIMKKPPPYTLSPEAQAAADQLKRWKNGDFSAAPKAGGTTAPAAAAPAEGKKSPADRFNELINSGKSKQEAYSTMKSEGY